MYRVMSDVVIHCCSQASHGLPLVPGVWQALRERGQPEEALGLPPGDLTVHLLPKDVAVLRLPRRLHPRVR